MNSRSVVSIAEYIRTGTLTRPKEIAPLQIARGPWLRLVLLRFVLVLEDLRFVVVREVVRFVAMHSRFPFAATWKPSCGRA